jgi:polyisoprenoid-binding protein YceI
VAAGGRDSFTVIGDLTFRGVIKDVALAASGLSGEIKDMWGNMRRGASAETRITRADFGLTFNSPLEAGGFLRSDEVDVEIDLQMIRASA